MKYKLLLTILLLTLSACGKSQLSSVILAGSTSVQPYAELLAEEYAILYPSSNVDVQGGGSSMGIRAAESGTANIGMSSRSLNESEQHLWQTEIARDGLAIIVHPENPVRNLTLSTIQEIYAGTLTHWNQIGGEDNRIHIIAREEGSGTRSAFDDLVMEKSRVSNRAIIQNSNGAIRQLVSLDKYAIGFISLGLVDESVMAIQIENIDASVENVQLGAYTLFRSFLFVCKSPPEGEIKRFIDFVLSNEGQQILSNEGLVPVR